MYSLIEFNAIGDHNGSLIALEKGPQCPFEIKRVYYIWGTGYDVVRGKHAHRDLEQVVVCVSGNCDFTLDDGEKRQVINLNRPDQGLYITGNVWREFTNFSPDCVIMVLANNYYDEKDYIRDYQKFLDHLSSDK